MLTETVLVKDASYLDDDSVSRQVDSPGQSGSTHETFYVPRREISLHQVPVLSEHACVVNPKTIWEKLLQLFVTRL